ncbi:MAG: hypothetical protein KDC80_22905, partial [Saprospiraceae bacterium]|nr:hypothetical protein [Saprospiraceae bacterium]
HPMQRSLYAKKGNSEFIEYLQSIYPDAYIIPEGGHHSLAQKGVGELVGEVRLQVPVRIDYWCCAYGTGSTALGILQELNNEEKLLAFLVLKGFNLGKTEDELVRGRNTEGDRLRLVEAHLGGYGKKSPELEKFILSFLKDFRILLDPVYTGKMFFQLFSEIRNGNIPEGSTILAVHSGGLQGIEGYNYRYGSKLPLWKESYL